MTGSGVLAAVVSFGSGLVVLTVMLAVIAPMRAGLVAVVQAIRSGRLPLWQVLGGTLGGIFVAVQSTTVPVIGVAVFAVAVVAGQSTNSLVVDAIGLGPAGRQPLTARRVVAAVVAVVAVSISVLDRVTSGTFSTWAVALAFVAGVLIAVQAAINGRVAVIARQPLTPTWTNFAGGTVLLVVLLLGTAASGHGGFAPLPGGPWWIYLGGLIGIAFIVTAAWVVPIVGVLLFALLSIAGQLTGALLLDVLMPAPGTQVSGFLVGGIALALVAVAISASGRRR